MNIPRLVTLILCCFHLSHVAVWDPANLTYVGPLEMLNLSQAWFVPVSFSDRGLVSWWRNFWEISFAMHCVFVFWFVCVCFAKEACQRILLPRKYSCHQPMADFSGIFMFVFLPQQKWVTNAGKTLFSMCTAPRSCYDFNSSSLCAQRNHEGSL